MGVIVIRCLATPRDFSTGIQIDRDDFRRLPEAQINSPLLPAGAHLVDAGCDDWIENKRKAPAWAVEFPGAGTRTYRRPGSGMAGRVAHLPTSLFAVRSGKL